MKSKLGTTVVNISLAVSAGLAGFMMLLRFTALSEPLIYDEVYSWVTAVPSVPLSIAWNHMLLQDVNLPLFNLLLRAWAYLVPNTVAWMRLLPALVSALTIPVAWWAAPKSWARTQKIIFCSLLAGSYTLTVHAHLLRTYSLAIFTTVLMSLLALRIVEAFEKKHPVSRKLWISFFGVGFLSAWLHFFATGLFFITALFLFLCSLKYKRNRKLIFWATAAAFAGWAPWLVNVFLTLNHFQEGWWYETNRWLSSWQILEYNIGSYPILLGVWMFLLIGLIFWGYAQRQRLKKNPEICLALFQILMLCLVVGVISLRYNLFLDRYFLILLPSLWMLLAGLLHFLIRQHSGLMLLLPVFLYANTVHYFTVYTPRTTDPTGLTQAFTYLHQNLQQGRALVVTESITYAGEAPTYVLNYFTPPDHSLTLLALTADNVARLNPPEQLPLVVPLCSFELLTNLLATYPLDLNLRPMHFGQTCVFVSPAPKTPQD